jgi:hypothetical protein
LIEKFFKSGAIIGLGPHQDAQKSTHGRLFRFQDLLLKIGIRSDH